MKLIYTSKVNFCEPTENTLVIYCSASTYLEATEEFIHSKNLKNYTPLVVPGGSGQIFEKPADVEKEIMLLKKVRDFSTIVAIAHGNCFYYKNLYEGMGPEELREKEVYDLREFRENSGNHTLMAHNQLKSTYVPFKADTNGCTDKEIFKGGTFW